jgi:sec-independent protein translocase protein TatB
MFNIGGGEILVILLVALIVLGPQRLPDAARKVGGFVGEVRRMATSFQNEVKTAFDDVDFTDRPPTRPKASMKDATTTTVKSVDPAPETPALDPAPEAVPPAAPPPARDNGQPDAVA